MSAGGAWLELGRIAVDSGRIALVDPAYAEELGREDAAWLGHEPVAFRPVPIGLAKDAALIVATPAGDGWYVAEGRFVEPEPGRAVLVELRLRLMPEELEPEGNGGPNV